MPIEPHRSPLQVPSTGLQSQRHRAGRRSGGATRELQAQYQRLQGASREKINPLQWLSFVAIGLISLTLIALIWTLTTRVIDDEAMELRAHTDQQVRSVAFVLAREIQHELQLVDQSLAIIQAAWDKDAGAVDLGAWRKQSLALTEVANDIFIANDRGIITQGTLPQSVGQGFGSAYVTYPNGSLEIFDSDGTTDPNGKPPGVDGVKARQFLTYIVRPLARPAGWFIGASYRSEGITRLLSGAQLGPTGIIALVALRRGGLQAISGPVAQSANMALANSPLIEQLRKIDAGIWAGVSPIDGISRIFGYQQIQHRDMSVLVGVSKSAANEPLAGLTAAARGLAALGSLAVLTIAGILVWAVAITNAARRRRRARERAEIELGNTRRELAEAQARASLSERETGALLGSATEGVACVDAALQLRQWNERFAERAGVALDADAPAEDLFRRQAAAGLFGSAAACEAAIAIRLTLLHGVTRWAEPLEQTDPDGVPLRLSVRGRSNGGYLLLLTEADDHAAANDGDATMTDALGSRETTDW
jgi:PAS domain-containing protein